MRAFISGLPRFVLCLILLLTMLSSVPATNGSVSAAERKVDWYGVTDRNKKYAGKGVWVTNFLDGYYTGRAFNGDELLAVRDTKYSVYGMIRTFKNGKVYYKCGTIPRTALKSEGEHRINRYSKTDKQTRQVRFQYEKCLKLKGTISDRNTIGKGFNCPDHFCVDGTFGTPLHSPPQCTRTVFYNLYLVNGVLRGYDPAGTENEWVHYRYTTKDDRWAAIRSNKLGWGYIQKRCIYNPALGDPQSKQYPQGGLRKCASLSPQEKAQGVKCSTK